MAYCLNCQHYMSPKELITKPMVCEGCGKKLRFDKKEYRAVTRPGIFTALLILFNTYYTPDPIYRAGIAIVLLILWFIFFTRFIKYLKMAQMEAF